MKTRTTRSIAFGTASLASFALALAVSSLLSNVAGRVDAVRGAEASLSRDASIVGEHLDGIFRIASLVLSGSGGQYGALTENALIVPEVANFLIVDASGMPLKSAYSRYHMSAISSPLLDKLRAGSRFETGAISVPFEDKRSLALLVRRENRNGEYSGAALAVFTDRLLDDAFAAHLGTSIESLYVTDASDTVILFRSKTKSRPAELRPLSSLFGSYRLRSVPLQVSVTADRAVLLAPVFRLRLTMAGIAFAFFAVFGFMSAFAFSAIRAAERSVALSRELELRDALFREVNHRVKNDLQIVRSILGLGISASENSADPTARNALQAAEDRINSISLVHEQMYKKAAVATTDLASYINALAENLRESYGKNRPIAISVEAESGLSLSMDAAVPCGLLLNELMTNSYKYAFPDSRSGRITVRASRTDEGGIELIAEDDGIGFSDNPAPRRDASFGLVLVDTLGSQLGAKITRNGGPGEGTRWRIVLPPPEQDTK